MLRHETYDSIKNNMPKNCSIDHNGVITIDGEQSQWRIDQKKGHWRLYDMNFGAVPEIIGKPHCKTIEKFFKFIGKKTSRKFEFS